MPYNIITDINIQVDYVFRTLDSDGEKKYQNTGISMKGSPEGKWNQFLYTRGSKSGQVGIFYVSLNYSEIPQVILGEEDDGLYVHVFPYTEEGGWDFEACKV